jgi:hypothetical protein
MKAIKMFSLAALTALLAMAFVGASSAMAESTGLCGHDGARCEAIHHVHYTSVGKAKLLTSIGTTECNVLLLGDVLAASDPLKIHHTITYTNCELLGGACTATEENGPAEIEILKEGHEKAKVTYTYLFHLVCGASIDCSYTGTGLVGTATGPLLSTQKNGDVTISGQKTAKEVGGFLCPKEAKLDITLTPLWPVYFRSGVLGYCVETEHSTGLYTNNTCTTLGSPEGHTYKYALVFAPNGGAVGEILCYGTLLPYGLWQAFNAFNISCENDDTTNQSLYEKGIVKTVE